MKHREWFAAALALTALVCGLVAPGWSRSRGTKQDPEEAIGEELKQIVERYRPTDEQKEQVRQILLVKHKATVEWNTTGEKAYEVAKSKTYKYEQRIKRDPGNKELRAAYDKARKEYRRLYNLSAKLRSNYSKEIDAVFPVEHKIRVRADKLREGSAGKYWEALDDDQRAKIKAVAEAAATKVYTVDSRLRSETAYQAAADVNKVVRDVVSPEFRLSLVVPGLVGYLKSRYRHLDLTRNQLARIKTMATEAAKQKEDWEAELLQVRARYYQLRRLTDYYGFQHILRADMEEKVLTKRQREKLYPPKTNR